MKKNEYLKRQEMNIFTNLRLLRKRPNATPLYTEIVRQARQPDFYNKLGVPDTYNGRFDLIALHAFIIMRRLKSIGKNGETLSQALFDCMFIDIDKNLREMGVGDLSVGKKIKNLAAAYYGRVKAYEGALLETDEFLDIIIGASEGQGRCWQRLSINTLNGIYDIINGLPSYPTEEYIDKFGSLRNENNEDYGTPIPYEVYISQASELLNMVNDNNTLLVSDMHDKDSCLPKELNCNKRNLINHIPESTTTFTNRPDLDGEFEEDSLDKIITTKNSNMKISNIEVHRYVRNVTEGHWPISFNVEWSG